MSKFSTDDGQYKDAKKNQEFFKECIEACMSNKLPKLKELLEKYLIDNPNINAQMLITGFQSEGKNLLHIASSSGHEDILDYILNQCSLISSSQSSTITYNSTELVNMQDDRGHTPLINAVIAENNSMVKTLIKLGANVNLKNKDGNTSVHFAAGDGSVERLEILVEAKADITCTSSSGTPLHWAAGKGRAKAIKYLIDKGSNINCLNDGGLPPVLLAAVSGSDEGTSLLVEAGCDIGHIVSGNLTLLHICAENCLTSSVSAILRTETGRKSCQVETADGNLPIHLAAMSKDREIISLLIPFTDGLTSTDIDAIIEDGKRRLELWEKKNNRNGNEDKNIASSTTAKEVENTLAATSKENEELSKTWKDKGNDFYKAAIKLGLDKSSESKIKKEEALREAINCYTEAIKLHGSDATYWCNRSVCHLTLGLPQQALTDAEVSRKLDPNWPKACFRLACARLELKQYEDAALAAFEGCKLDQNNNELKELLNKAVKLGRDDYQSSQKK